MIFEFRAYYVDLMRRKGLRQDDLGMLAMLPGKRPGAAVSGWVRLGTQPDDAALRKIAELDGLPDDFLIIQDGLNLLEKRGVNLERLADPVIWEKRNQRPIVEVVELHATGTDAFTPNPPSPRPKPGRPGQRIGNVFCEEGGKTE